MRALSVVRVERVVGGWAGREGGEKMFPRGCSAGGVGFVQALAW